MDAGESVAEACAREVGEETGLEVRIERLIGVYSNPHRLLEYADGGSIFPTDAIPRNWKIRAEEAQRLPSCSGWLRSVGKRGVGNVGQSRCGPSNDHRPRLC